MSPKEYLFAGGISLEQGFDSVPYCILYNTNTGACVRKSNLPESRGFHEIVYIPSSRSERIQTGEKGHVYCIGGE